MILQPTLLQCWPQFPHLEDDYNSNQCSLDKKSFQICLAKLTPKLKVQKWNDQKDHHSQSNQPFYNLKYKIHHVKKLSSLLAQVPGTLPLQLESDSTGHAGNIVLIVEQGCDVSNIAGNSRVPQHVTLAPETGEWN